MTTTLATVQPDALALAWTPEALKEEVEREKALRSVVIEYYQSQLKPGHHYYNLPGQGAHRKPALAKEGALNLCSLFKVVPEPDQPHETWGIDGHYTVRFRYHLRSLRTGQIVATGDGSCTTLEAKYAYRWLFSSEIPAAVDKETLSTRTIKTKHGRVPQWRVPNADLADTYNTVLKMAAKRALVDASFKLPLVSELFTQDLEEQITERASDDESEEAITAGSVEPRPDGSTPGMTPAPGSDVPPSSPRIENSARVMRRLKDAITASGLPREQIQSLSQTLFGQSDSKALTLEQLETLAEELEGLAHSRGAQA